MVVAIPLFEKMTALDAVGPYEVLWRLPDVKVVFVGRQTGTIESERPLGLRVDEKFDDVPAPEVVLVPGGSHTEDMVADTELVEWVKQAHETSTWTASVCTGALVLGAAGILEGLDATTHWGEAETLKDYGARYLPERIVKRGKVITGAGVSAGIDTALQLAAEISGEDIAQATQLLIEYDPDPPFHSGSFQDAPDAIKQLAFKLHRYNQGDGPPPKGHTPPARA